MDFQIPCGTPKLRNSKNWSATEPRWRWTRAATSCWRDSAAARCSSRTPPRTLPSATTWWSSHRASWTLRNHFVCSTCESSNRTSTESWDEPTQTDWGIVYLSLVITGIVKLYSSISHPPPPSPLTLSPSFIIMIICCLIFLICHFHVILEVIWDNGHCR